MLLIVVLATATSALAAGKAASSMMDHNAGPTVDSCGLGWQVTDKKTYTATTTRGTTNAFIPPTFGMTTGTIGCEKLDIGKNDKEAADYCTVFSQVGRKLQI